MRTFNTAAAALLARAQAGEQMPAVQLLFVNLAVPQYLTNAGVPLIWGGQTWSPTDVAISEIDDDSKSLNGMTFAFPGVTTAQIALGFEDTDGVVVRIYDAMVDPATGIIADAILAWSGELDLPGWEDGPKATILFAAEHRGQLALRPKPSRYTNDEQQRLYPGDTSLNFDPATDAAPLVWPAASYFRK